MTDNITKNIRMKKKQKKQTNEILNPDNCEINEMDMPIPVYKGIPSALKRMTIKDLRDEIDRLQYCLFNIEEAYAGTSPRMTVLKYYEAQGLQNMYIRELLSRDEAELDD